MSRSAMIESLEDRRLLSASPFATKSKFPSILGSFTGTEIYSSGVTYSVIIKITKQHGSSFTGSVVESSGITASVSGTISRKDDVRFFEHGLKRHHFSSVVVGTLGTDTISATFTKTASGLNFHGSINVTRPTTTT
jgi:hypothetical protein